jgi:hypothetical protein
MSEKQYREPTMEESIEVLWDKLMWLKGYALGIENPTVEDRADSMLNDLKIMRKRFKTAKDFTRPPLTEAEARKILSGE